MVSNSTTGGEKSRSEDASDEVRTDADSVVSVRNLTKVYDGNVRAVDDVSFDVDRGSVVGLLGPNGAGKTTCMKSILGLVSPTSGTVTVSGFDIEEEPKKGYQHVGAVLEGARNIYWRFTVRENLEFFGSIAGNRPSEMRERHDELLEQFGLRDKADVQVNNLSRGMKQKATLACTLSRNIDVALLDEPTLGLDIESSIELQRELRRLADQNSMTLIVSSHDMDVIERICDRVIIMNDGHIIADDTVKNLVEVFQVQTYRVTVEGMLTESIRTTLTDDFNATDWSQVDERTYFSAPLTDGAEIRDLLDTLLDADYHVGAIDTVETDLEEIFLELTEDDGTAESSANGTKEVFQ